MKTSKPLTFVPPKHGRGKWHAVSCGASCLPVCGKAVELDPQSSVREVIAGGTEIDTLHPTYCRKCLTPVRVRLVKTPDGYVTADGRYAVVRSREWAIRGARGGVRNVTRYVVRDGAVKFGQSLDTLREARSVVLSLYEGSVR